MDESGTYEASFGLDYDGVGTYIFVIENASATSIAFDYEMDVACLA